MKRGRKITTYTAAIPREEGGAKGKKKRRRRLNPSLKKKKENARGKEGRGEEIIAALLVSPGRGRRKGKRGEIEKQSLSSFSTSRMRRRGGAIGGGEGEERPMKSLPHSY